MTMQMTPELRAQLTAELEEGGFTPSDIQMILDLALHAVDNAGETIIRTVAPMPFHTQQACMLVTNALLHIVTDQNQCPGCPSCQPEGNTPTQH